MKIINNNNEIEKIMHQWQEIEEIEEALINQNIIHHKKVLNANARKDKIYNKLFNNETRNKIINRTLRKDKYSTNDIHNFLMLL